MHQRVSAPAEYAVVQAIKETPEMSIEETQAVLDAPSAPETLNKSMVFTKSQANVDVHIDNNPLWPANAASATYSDVPAALVITPSDAFMMPISQTDTLPKIPYEPELQALPIQAVVQAALPLKAPHRTPRDTQYRSRFFKNIASSAQGAQPSQQPY